MSVLSKDRKEVDLTFRDPQAQRHSCISSSTPGSSCRDEKVVDLQKGEISVSWTDYLQDEEEIDEAHYDSWIIANTAGVHSDIDWNNAAALEYLGASGLNTDAQPKIQAVFANTLQVANARRFLAKSQKTNVAKHQGTVGWSRFEYQLRE